VALGTLLVDFRARRSLLRFAESVKDRLELRAHQRPRRSGVRVVPLVEHILLQACAVHFTGNSSRLRATVATDRITSLAADKQRIPGCRDGKQGRERSSTHRENA